MLPPFFLPLLPPLPLLAPPGNPPPGPPQPSPQFPSIFDPFSRPSLSQIFQVPPAGSPRFQGHLSEHRVQHRAPRDLNTFSFHGPPLLFFSPLRLGCPPPRKMVDKLGQIARAVGCPVPCALCPVPLPPGEQASQGRIVQAGERPCQPGHLGLSAPGAGDRARLAP